MNKKSSKNIFLAFILNLIFSIIEFVGGIFTNSISIISDSIHDLGDAISIAVSWILEKKSEKKPDTKYTFGYARYSVLGALITSTVLLLGSVVMVYNAVPRILNPVQVNYDGMIIFGILGVLINGTGAVITSRSNRLNEKSVSLHMFEDVLGWVAVFIASILMKIFDLPIIDPILSIFITLYILWHVVKNYKSIFAVFLQKAPDNVEFEKLKEKLIQENNFIKEIHHTHVWSLDGVNTYISLHVVMPNDVTVEDIIKTKKYIKHEAEHYSIFHTIIEIEFENEICEDKECNVEINGELLKSHHHHNH